MRYLFFILLYSICIFSYGGTIDPNTSDEKYIEYGKQFKCIGHITGTYRDKTLYGASGVAIDDHHILTAAHVVKNSESCYFEINDKKLYVSKIIVHDDFEKKYNKGDIALGYIETDIALESYPILYNETDELNKIASICGYGFHGTFLTGPLYYDSNKRAGQNTIEAIENNLLICSPSKSDDQTFTKLEFLICVGDSGGGLFINEKLAGINSCIMKTGGKSPDAKYGTESGHTRISDYIDWIELHK